MEMFRDELLSEGVKKERIIFINFEDFEYRALRNSDSLYSFIKERLTSEMNYIFLDEIQRVENFPDVVDSLYIKKMWTYTSPARIHPFFQVKLQRSSAVVM